MPALRSLPSTLTEWGDHQRYECGSAQDGSCVVPSVPGRLETLARVVEPLCRICGCPVERAVQRHVPGGSDAEGEHRAGSAHGEPSESRCVLSADGQDRACDGSEWCGEENAEEPAVENCLVDGAQRSDVAAIVDVSEFGADRAGEREEHSGQQPVGDDTGGKHDRGNTVEHDRHPNPEVS